MLGTCCKIQQDEDFLARYVSIYMEGSLELHRRYEMSLLYEQFSIIWNFMTEVIAFKV